MSAHSVRSRSHGHIQKPTRDERPGRPTQAQEAMMRGAMDRQREWMDKVRQMSDFQMRQIYQGVPRRR